MQAVDSPTHATTRVPDLCVTLLRDSSCEVSHGRESNSGAGWLPLSLKPDAKATEKPAAPILSPRPAHGTAQHDFDDQLPGAAA
jgi:hypothetical protein